MLKKILFGLLAFVLGVFVAFYFETNFRELIRIIFIWSTEGDISFRGKDFYIVHRPIYYISFGLTFYTLMISLVKGHNAIRNIKTIILFLLIFGISILGISTILAFAKIVHCTACQDGTRTLHPSDVNYENVVAVSLGLAIIPSLIYIFMKKNKK